MIRNVLLLLLLITVSNTVLAEGFAINVQGNKQTGMGHVGAALSWDASSLQFNPGALIAMPQNYSFTAGTSLTFITNEFTKNNNTHQSKSTVRTPCYFYGAGKISDRLAVGLGVYTPYGNTLDWGKQWDGRYLVQDITLETFYIQPTISFALTENLSIGAGPTIVIGNFSLNKAIPQTIPTTQTTLPDGSINLSANGMNVGYNVGIYYRKNKFSAGVSYRSEVEMSAEGDSKVKADPNFINFLKMAGATNPEAMGQYIALTADKMETALPLGATLKFGVAYRFGDKWTVSADIDYVFWSSYENLRFDFSHSDNPSLPTIPSIIPKRWKNSMTYRIGVNYASSQKLDLRAGFYYDETPTQSTMLTPETPGANKMGFSCGASYMITERLGIDASLLYIAGEKRTATSPDNSLSGQYQNTGFLPGIGISYQF